MNKNFNYSRLFKELLVVSLSGAAFITPMNLSYAADVQIYADGTSDGNKTFVMMLDDSGSMGSVDLPRNVTCKWEGATNNQDFNPYVSTEDTITSPSGVKYKVTSCMGSNGVKQYDRISNLKIAIFNLTETASIPSEKSRGGTLYLKDVVIGVGAFNSGTQGRMWVSAAKFGDIGSPQRLAIQNAIANLQPSGGTPTAYAYAEGVAHLMGTSTSEKIIDRYRKSGNTWQACTAWDQSNIFTAGCTSWSDLATQPTDLPDYYNFTKYPVGKTGDAYYRKIVTGQTWKAIELYHVYLDNVNWRECQGWSNNLSNGVRVCNNWSGWKTTPMPDDLKISYNNTLYKAYFENSNNNQLIMKYGLDGDGVYVNYSSGGFSSPLPEASKRQSCDGQGVYILSDGEPNNTSVSNNEKYMKNALSLPNTNFSCSGIGGLSDTSSSSGWQCMGEFAKRLVLGNNVQGLSFKTAFVGYGASFNSLTNQDQINACKLGSKKAGDSCSPDAATASLRNDDVGYGLGGYTYAQSSQDVLNSIIKFLSDLGTASVKSLPTGAWSVPSDTLNPQGLQPYAYMRVLQPEPGAGRLSWAGNLKKYNLVDGVLRAGDATTSSAVLSTIVANYGQFAGPSDMWSTTTADGGSVTLGGAYAKVPLPVTGAATSLRRVFTDLKNDQAGTGLEKIGNDTNVASTDLLKIVDRQASDTTNATFVLNKFANQDVLKVASNRIKRTLLNYLGYSVELNDTALPTTLDTPTQKSNSMGGVMHSLPLQLTYEGTLDADGNLTTTRAQSTLFGTMEGGLRLVDASSGNEQMVFVPADILLTDWARALKSGEASTNGLANGVDGAWTADSAYVATTVGASTLMKASRMNIYGGLRMGGSSYYGLDVVNPTDTKFLFRIGSDQTNFQRMGQSWSKPTLANIRYQGKIRRVMIVGGGYDECYEDPRFVLKSSGDNTTCANKTIAKGNAVYIVDALTGERLWWASNTGANGTNTNLKHSIVSGISAVDGDNDGLADHLYFGDLGGQVFRIDLNNNTTTSSSATATGVRVVRMANLATTTAGVEFTNGDNPRFYETPTVTVHRDLGSRFIAVSVVSGDRSSPLDVAPTVDRIGLPAVLTGRPANNVYALMDIDAVKRNIMASDVRLEVNDLNRARLLVNPNASALNAASLIRTYAPYNVAPAVGQTDNRIFGWSRSLSSDYTGAEKANGTFRKLGGIKAYEAPVAISNNLILTVYDPESKQLNPNADACLPRIIGETYRQYYCLPFGRCMTVNSAGVYGYDVNAEKNTGYQDPTNSTITSSNKTPIGPGIQGNVLGGKIQTTATECGALQLAGIANGTGEWECSIKQQPLNWYSSSIKAN